MRFVDSNVLIYAFLKPKKEPDKSLAEIKNRAVEILKRIQEGEEIATTVVHLSEVANLIASRKDLKTSAEFIFEFMSLKNAKVFDVSEEDYLKASLIAIEKEVDVNDALAYLKMKENGIREIYTFDSHFRKLDVLVEK
ncbi:MAG: type II toxin-antitoxin system VapC family toxin [Archaeoglobaceae archaeon]